jgi:Peptidase M15
LSKRLLTAATAIALSALALPARAGPYADDAGRAMPLRIAAAPEAQLPPLVPPVPQLAIRPPKANMPEAPLVPPVPQPAIRPQRLAALPDAQLAPLVPPIPQLAIRPPRRDSRSDRLRACLKPEARALLDRIEAEFGPMEVISTCRPGARIAGTGRISKHATGEAIDFNAGSRKGDVVRWLIANHRDGGTMTYAGMSHIHVDVGHHFVALNAR